VRLAEKSGDFDHVVRKIHRDKALAEIAAEGIGYSAAQILGLNVEYQGIIIIKCKSFIRVADGEFEHGVGNMPEFRQVRFQEFPARRHIIK
jgi:hypothetical protein